MIDKLINALKEFSANFECERINSDRKRIAKKRFADRFDAGDPAETIVALRAASFAVMTEDGLEHRLHPDKLYAQFGQDTGLRLKEFVSSFRSHVLKWAGLAVADIANEAGIEFDPADPICRKAAWYALASVHGFGAKIQAPKQAAKLAATTVQSAAKLAAMLRSN